MSILGTAELFSYPVQRIQCWRRLVNFSNSPALRILLYRLVSRWVLGYFERFIGALLSLSFWWFPMTTSRQKRTQPPWGPKSRCSRPMAISLRAGDYDGSAACYRATKQYSPEGASGCNYTNVFVWSFIFPCAHVPPDCFLWLSPIQYSSVSECWVTKRVRGNIMLLSNILGLSLELLFNFCNVQLSS